MWCIIGAFEEIEISRAIGFQAGAVAMATACGNAIAVEVFVVISFAVVIEIVQDRDLIAAKDVDFILDDLQPERLKKSGGKTFPGELLQFGVDATDAPNIAMRRANSRIPIGEKIVAAGEHERVPRILIRNRQRIDQKWACAKT